MTRNPTSSYRTSRAFTLLELLVVIAIICLLAAILFPVFEQARQNAMRSSCQSNLKQLSLGVIQYTQDYDEYPPCGLWDGAGLNAWPWHFGLGWAGQVYPFVRQTGVFQCPEDTIKPGATTFPLSYAYNGNIAGGPFNTAIETPMSSMTQPSRTILFTEGSSPYPYNATYPIMSGNLDTSSPACDGIFYDNNLSNSGSAYCEVGLMSDVGIECGFQAEISVISPPTTGWHFGGANFAFMDGHVKWLLGSQVSPGENALTGNPLVPNPNAVQEQTNAGRGYAAGTNGKFASGTFPAGTYSIT